MATLTFNSVSLEGQILPAENGYQFVVTVSHMGHYSTRGPVTLEATTLPEAETEARAKMDALSRGMTG